MADNVSSKVIDKSKDEDYPFRKRVIDYRKFIKFYFIPILSVLIFLVIVVFTVVPSVVDMLEGLDEVKQLEAKSDELDKRIARLEQLQEQEQTNRAILDKVNVLIPSEQSQVVLFRQKVANLGKDQGLDVDSLRAGESILDDNNQSELETQQDQAFNLIEIPSRFSFTGRFDSFRELLRSLYAGNDFFVVSNMDLDVNSIGATNTTWKGEFDLIKYQFSEDSQTENYLEVSDFAEANATVVKFIEDNFIESSLD